MRDTPISLARVARPTRPILTVWLYETSVLYYPHDLRSGA